MTDMRELPALLVELLANIDIRTGVPKFPARATEIVKEISTYAQTTQVYAEWREGLQAAWAEDTLPGEILQHMLKKLIHARVPANGALVFVCHAPALEKALAAQRRCRVCGCTDDNACMPNSCYWVEPDLCSECAKIKEGGA